jgi:glycosyltransferase involved in cell wall biosynthesis
MSAVTAPHLAKVPISVCIISKNAAEQIGACIDSVKFADEVLVVDSGSEDATREVAASRGCRVLEHEWLGFGKQKQLAVSLAKHNWVLCIDVDERVTPALAESISRALGAETGPAFHVYAMPRRNRFLGRWLGHGEGYPDRSRRLFHREHAAWSDVPVHETVVGRHAGTMVGDLSGDLLHESAEDIATYLQKQNRYSSLHAELLFARGERASYAKLVLSPLARFLKFYVFRLGFLDGGPGFAHIAIGCFAAFAKYAKLIELANRPR